MDVVNATKAYINRMVEQTPGVKVLLLDAETVSAENNEGIDDILGEKSLL